MFNNILIDIESCYNSILRNDNFQAKIDIEDINKEVKEILQRIDKAIDYIKELQNSDLVFSNIAYKELLDILGDKE